MQLWFLEYSAADDDDNDDGTCNTMPGETESGSPTMNLYFFCV